MTHQPTASERPTDRSPAARIEALDLLRGLAALAVCFYHFTDPRDGLFREGDPLRNFTRYGWLGVEVFFVISGFVIPYSMYLRAYRLRDAGGFLARRLKRLEPPYLVCIVLILGLNWLWTIIPGMDAKSQSVTAPQVFAHLGYLNAILDSLDSRWNYAWLNPVFWTLAIEFQFYIFMAVVFPLLLHKSRFACLAATLAIALLGFIPSNVVALLPHWLPLFAVGIATFQSYAGKLPVAWYVALMIPLTAMSWQIVGDRQTAVGVATALTIRLVAARQVPRFLAPLMFLGMISYSLYLVHIPIGEPLIDALSRQEVAYQQRYFIAVAGLAVSVVIAFLFWYAIERPSQAWARGTSIGTEERSPQATRPHHELRPRQTAE